MVINNSIQQEHKILNTEKVEFLYILIMKVEYFRAYENSEFVDTKDSLHIIFSDSGHSPCFVRCHVFYDSSPEK